MTGLNNYILTRGDIKDDNELIIFENRKKDQVREKDKDNEKNK